MPDPSAPTHPAMIDLTPENITQHTLLINSQAPDLRLRYLLQRMIVHLHDFARETRLTTEEWMAALIFLTQVGQMCSDTRQEFILLSDTLGLSALIETINHPKPPSATPGTVLGPFHTHDAPVLPSGASISSPSSGSPCLILGRITTTTGAPISGAKIDMWETDSTGHYDTQYASRSAPDNRGVVHSDDNGDFWVKAIRPVSYPIPHDGPVGKMLRALKRHPFRPAHVHFMIEKEGYDTLVTSLFVKGDEYLGSDAVFGVKSGLVVELGKVEGGEAERYGVEEGCWRLQWVFVMVGEEEARALRREEAMRVVGLVGGSVDEMGLPVADVD